MLGILVIHWWYLMVGWRYFDWIIAICVICWVLWLYIGDIVGILMVHWRYFSDSLTGIAKRTNLQLRFAQFGSALEARKRALWRTSTKTVGCRRRSQTDNVLTRPSIAPKATLSLWLQTSANFSGYFDGTLTLFLIFWSEYWWYLVVWRYCGYADGILTICWVAWWYIDDMSDSCNILMVHWRYRDSVLAIFWIFRKCHQRIRNTQNIVNISPKYP